jgi:predicted nucleotidyltransferase component of viral defense system
MLTDLQLREVFHFCFLERLLKLTSPAQYALKGGVNLRFFFHSPRYSEDMDLDVLAGGVGTLKKNGYKILGDAGFARSLRVYGIDTLEINDPGKAKHTEVTQRFRVGLITASGQRLPTKVEFSRRPAPTSTLQTELIDPEIARQYRKLSFRVQHYPGELAARQKIAALYGRATTQARDVFDLGLLLAGGYITRQDAQAAFTAQEQNNAVQCVMSLGFEAFAGQVLEFLPEHEREHYASPAAWAQLQESVVALFGA